MRVTEGGIDLPKLQGGHQAGHLRLLYFQSKKKLLQSPLYLARHSTWSPPWDQPGQQMSVQFLSTYSRQTMVSNDLLVLISPQNVTRLIHLVEKFSKNPFFLDPVKAAEAAQLKSLTGTLLKKYGPHNGAGVQSATPKPKAAGRSSGPPLSTLRRKLVSKEMKEQIKGRAALSRSHSGH